jgi:hypothetical protein
VNTPIQIVLAVVGTGAGVSSAVLGITALKHLENADEVDKTVGWSLWWFTDGDRYNAKGKQLCKVGGIMFATGVASWLAFFILPRL